MPSDDVEVDPRIEAAAVAINGVIYSVSWERASEGVRAWALGVARQALAAADAVSPQSETTTSEALDLVRTASRLARKTGWSLEATVAALRSAVSSPSEYERVIAAACAYIHGLTDDRQANYTAWLEAYREVFGNSPRAVHVRREDL